MSVEQQTQTPAAQNSVETPAGAPATQSVVTTPAAPVAQQQQGTAAGADPASGPPAPPAADPRAEIDAFAESLGIDPAGLADVTDMGTARQRVQQWLDQQAQQGMAFYEQQQYPYQYVPPTPPQQQPYYQQPQYPQTVPGTMPQQQPSVNLKELGLEPDDPVAKVILAMDARAQQQQAAVEKLVGHFEQQAAQVKAQARAQRVAEAEAAVDKWNSPLYGKSGRRTVAQNSRLDSLKSLANAYITQDWNNGLPLLTVEHYMNRARFTLDNQPSTPAAQQHALPSVQPPSPPVNAPTLSMNERWSENEAFMASLRR